MKIRSMSANFGGLQAARLELGEGLNLVSAPNEAGKSTWCAFLKAMLYGIDTRERDKKGYLAEKNRYQPWSGLPMEGEVCLEWQGQEITIRRGPRGSTPFGSFSAVYTASGQEVPGLTAANCGEMLTGVGREVYERSAFIGQGGALTVTAAPELEKRIAALVTTGREDVSYAQAEKRLKEMRNRRWVNRSVGRIPELEGELARLEGQLSDLEGVAAQVVELSAKRSALVKAKTLLEQERDGQRRQARGELDRRYTQAEDELTQAEQRLSDLEREFARFGPQPEEKLLLDAQSKLAYLKVLDEEIARGQEEQVRAEEDYIQAQRALQEGPFAGMTGQEAQAQVERQLHADEDNAARAARWKRRGAGAMVLAAVEIIAVQVIMAVGQGAYPAAAWFQVGLPVLGVVLFLAGVWCLFRGKKQGTGRTTLERYEVADREALSALLKDYQDRCGRAEEANRRCAQVRGGVNDCQARRENTHSDLMDFVHAFAPEVRTLNGCSAALSRALKLGHDLELARQQVTERRQRLDDLSAQGGARTEQVPGSAPAWEHEPRETERLLAQVTERLAQADRAWNQALGRQEEMGDPARLNARREQVREELDRRRGELEAIDLAMDALVRANSRLRERFSPALNQRAGDYLARMTGGRYTALTLNREMEGSAARAGDPVARDALFLSRGTVDQLYLAVRLAVCELCLPQRPTVVLDDALADFDDGRARAALDLLRELAGEQQVLLFTCHSREEDYLKQFDDVRLCRM